MSVNLSKKWIVIVFVLTLIIGGYGWWFNSTKANRKRETEYKQLVKFANRQEVEIAVLKQSKILQQLKAQRRKMNQEVQKPEQYKLPKITDPKDVK